MCESCCKHSSARTTIADFKRDLHAALEDCFVLSKADTASVSHPFVTATVLDPATKRCELCPESLRNAAYDHVRPLASEAATSLLTETDDGDADESALPPAKRAMTDSHSASLKLLATAAVTLVPAADSDFDRFLVAPAPSGADALGWNTLDDRLITNYHVTMIGYGKKAEFHIPTVVNVDES